MATTEPVEITQEELEALSGMKLSPGLEFLYMPMAERFFKRRDKDTWAEYPFPVKP